MTSKQSGRAPINGLDLHYEISGKGDPLIYIPSAFSHAGLVEFPRLARRWQVIQLDLQGHGRTPDIDRPLSFAQHAEDVVALMRHLAIGRAHLFGWSYGGLIAVMIALSHAELVDRVATYGSLFGRPEDAIRPEMLAEPQDVSPDTPALQFQRESWKKLAPDPDHWPVILEKMVNIRVDGFTREQLASLTRRILIALGDHDFIRIEHAVEVFSTIPRAELAVIPDAGHFFPYEEPERLEPILEQFFSAPEERLPFTTIASGYHPGETR